MKIGPFTSAFVALLISIELILSPLVAFAKKDDVGFVEVTAATSAVLGAAATVYNAFSAQNQAMSPEMLMMIEKMKQQQAPKPDKYFNPQKLSQIPGLNEYLARNGINPNSLFCTTLPSTLTAANLEVCRTGVKSTMGNPAVQDMQAQIMAKQYSNVEKIYKNFSTQTNTGGEMFGVGCMKKASQILNGFFKSRIDELDKLSTNIEAIQNSFIEASKADLNAIKESTALLDGGNGEFASELKSKNPGLFDFGKRFDNPACGSMFSKDEFNTLGQKGLNNINDSLIKSTSAKVPPMNYSAESYEKFHNEVVSDINSFADKVAKQMETNFKKVIDNPNGNYGEIVQALGKSVGSSTKLNGSITPDLFSDSQNKFQKQFDELIKEKSEVAGKVGGEEMKAFQFLGSSNSGAFEAELTNMETAMKNDCLRNQSRLDTVLDKIYDPSATNFANQNASNFLKDKIAQIMNDSETTIEQKLDELKKIESNEGSRYRVKMENSYEVQEVDAKGKLVSRVVPASVAKTPGVFFSDVIRSCQAQFKANSGASNLNKLRKLHSSFQALASSQAAEVRNEIKSKLLNCESQSKASGSAPGTCNQNVFNTGASGFCASAALSCSKKMNECTKQVQKVVETLKNDRAVRVKNYKGLVENNKKQIVSLFDNALSKYMKEGELLRGAFGAGFSSPSGIQRQIPDGEKYMNSFAEATSNSPDGALLLEDPEKFTEMFKKNIDTLKKTVQEQQEKILGGDVGSNSGILAQHIEETEKNYSKVEQEAAKIAQQCTAKHDEFVTQMDQQRKQQQAEAMKKQSELGQKNQKFCRQYGLAMTNPGPACQGSIEDTFDAVATLPGGSDAINEYQRVCSGYSNQNPSGSVSEQAWGICLERKEENGNTASTSKDRDEGLVTHLDSQISALSKAINECKEPKDNCTIQIKSKPGAKDETVTGLDKMKAKLTEFESSKTAAQGTSSSQIDSEIGGTDLDKNCSMFKACEQKSESKPNPLDPNQTIKSTVNNCDASKINSLAKTIIKLAGNKQDTASEESLPAFCTAGNGDTGFKGFVNAISGGIQQGMGAGAIGQ